MTRDLDGRNVVSTRLKGLDILGCTFGHRLALTKNNESDAAFSVALSIPISYDLHRFQPELNSLGRSRSRSSCGCSPHDNNRYLKLRISSRIGGINCVNR